MAYLAELITVKWNTTTLVCTGANLPEKKANLVEFLPLNAETVSYIISKVKRYGDVSLKVTFDPSASTTLTEGETGVITFTFDGFDPVKSFAFNAIIETIGEVPLDGSNIMEQQITFKIISKVS